MAARAWAYLKVAKMEWIVMISVFAFDLIAKALVENFIDYGDTVTLIPYVFNAHRIHNYAAAFGSSALTGWMGPVGSRIFYCVFAVAASVAFILVLIKNKGKSKMLRVSLALFVAGAMGNCIDRMILGYVRDFIEFVYFGGTIGGRTTWAYIFNIADVSLVTGVIFIIFYFLFLYRDPDKKKRSVADADGVPIDMTAESSDANDETVEYVDSSVSDNAATVNDTETVVDDGMPISAEKNADDENSIASVEIEHDKEQSKDAETERTELTDGGGGN